jgi:phosphoribosylformylglycinamidine (FGAM) synthase-like enzyme
LQLQVEPHRHLKKLPTEGPQVICGPGENAGVVDIGDGQAAIFKMESHNHPSYIEPYQGAATGVGGILRDVFTMGARPVANMNALRFGARATPRCGRWSGGVVRASAVMAIASACRPWAARCNFHKAYDGNILVNAMTVGVADRTRSSIRRLRRRQPDRLCRLQDRARRHPRRDDGFADFSEDSEEKRPTVQVGDPFTEKLLIEACLELMATDAIVAIQDMGAAGLTSSSSRWRPRAASASGWTWTRSRSAKNRHDGL